MGRGILAVMAVWFAVAAVAQEEVVLTPLEVLVLAERAAVAGDFAGAEQLSSLILAGEPENARALLVRAAVARAAGALEDAGEIGGRAYRATDNPAVRFEAAMLVADVRASEERFFVSQLWLRRADQAAATEQQRAIVANAFGVVAQVNPWSVQLRFGVQPSSNVNNGALVDTVDIVLGSGTVAFNVEEQLSGYDANIGLSLGYRLSEDETQRTDLLGEIFYRKVFLDGDAKRKAPAADSSDFDYGVVVVGARHSRLIWPELGVSRVTGLVGRSWYGGEALARWGELQFSQGVRQGEAALLTFGLTMRAESQLDRASTTSDDTINSNHTVEVSVDRAQIIDGKRLSYGLALKNWWSDSQTVDSSATTLRASWQLGEMWGVQSAVNGSLERRIFHNFLSAPDGRRDTSMSVGVTASLSDVSFYGFVPQAQLQLRRTWSSFDLYDRKSYSLGLTAVSRF